MSLALELLEKRNKDHNLFRLCVTSPLVAAAYRIANKPNALLELNTDIDQRDGTISNNVTPNTVNYLTIVNPPACALHEPYLTRFHYPDCNRTLYLILWDSRSIKWTTNSYGKVPVEVKLS